MQWGLPVVLFKEEVSNFCFSLDLFLSLLNFDFYMFLVYLASDSIDNEQKTQTEKGNQSSCD